MCLYVVLVNCGTCLHKKRTKLGLIINELHNTKILAEDKRIRVRIKVYIYRLHIHKRRINYKIVNLNENDDMFNIISFQHI